MCVFLNLCGGCGLVMFKVLGNEYEYINDGVSVLLCICLIVGGIVGMIGCENFVNDLEVLELGVIVVGVVNVKGIKLSYFNVGLVNWIIGLGGEYGDGGKYGEIGSGLKIFFIDFSGCVCGYSWVNLDDINDFVIVGIVINLKDNVKCDYLSMNGMLVVMFMLFGVVVLMLVVNLNLMWCDVCEILCVIVC